VSPHHKDRPYAGHTMNWVWGCGRAMRTVAAGQQLWRISSFACAAVTQTTSFIRQ